VFIKYFLREIKIPRKKHSLCRKLFFEIEDPGHNVMLYIQKSVSENAGIAVIGVEKYKTFLGENTPRPPY
jgi:hypothetical protein